MWKIVQFVLIVHILFTNKCRDTSVHHKTWKGNVKKYEIFIFNKVPEYLLAH